MVKKRKKRTRGNLIKGVLLNISSDHFEAVGKELKKTIHGKPGIYALYKEDRLYYVGLASSLYGRVRWHLKDLETAIITIAEPKGNSTKGSIPNQRFLKRLLRKRIKEKRRTLKTKMINKNEEIENLKDSINQIEKAI